MTTKDAIDALKNQVGVDASRPELLAVVNDRHKRAVTRARWRKATVELGPTVVNQSNYSLPASPSITEILSLGVAGNVWQRTGEADLMRFQSGQSFVRDWRGTGGLYAPSHDSSGGLSVELWPVPTSAGQSVSALGVVEPDDLLDQSSSVSTLPVEFHEAILVDGPLATMYRRLDARTDLAAVHEQIFDGAVAELLRRTNLVVGGTVQVQIYGAHF